MQLQWRYFHIAGDSGPRTRLRLDNILVTSGLPSGGPASFAAWIADPSFGVPAERQGPHDDPAGDGMANFLKFAFGLHPMVPSAHAGPVMALSINGPPPFLTLTYRQRTGGHGTPGIDYVADGLRYTVPLLSD
ncbi:MAG: hypothetical protein JJT96_19595 [Opitutales bacterium]|nr:hypothetical protein [Opitutales bacterium]